MERDIQLTAPKGIAVIGQSGGPTSVINETLVGAIREALKHPVITEVYGARHGIEGILRQEFLDLKAESQDVLETVARTPSAALGSVRRKPTPDDCQRMVDLFRAHGVRYLFYIGGNDSAETAHIVRELARESSYDLRVCHLPKTIDNDLKVTDHSPGYGSAARFVAMALMGDDLDNRSLPGVKIDIIMGRHAGFLTAATVLGRREADEGPHLVYVPEAPFDLDRFLGDVDRCVTRLGRCVIAVSEGIAYEDGSPVFTTGERDSHGNVQLSGRGALGDHLAEAVRESLGVKRVRADTFGYLQRSFPGVISLVDSGEAREAGAYGVRMLAEGKTESGSVAIRRTADGKDYASEMFITELSSVARKTRRLDAKFISHEKNQITQAFLDYALPLVGDLPTHGRLGAKTIRLQS